MVESPELCRVIRLRSEIAEDGILECGLADYSGGDCLFDGWYVVGEIVLGGVVGGGGSGLCCKVRPYHTADWC